jgi:hypothetical protein
MAQTEARSGARVWARLTAVIAPIEWPTRCTRSRSIVAWSATVSRRASRARGLIIIAGVLGETSRKPCFFARSTITPAP